MAPGLLFVYTDVAAGPVAPWRNRIVAGALSRERRVLSFRNSFC